MYIERVPNRNSPPCILLRESFRHEGKVKHRTLANLTDWPKHILAGLRLLLEGQSPSLTLSSESFRITRSLPHGHVQAVLGVVHTLGLGRLLGSKLSPERNLALAMIVARILDPGSKLATARSLDCQTLSSTLAQECHLEGSIHENELYAAMDWLVSRQARIENAFATRHLEEGCLVLYDLTSSYLQGKCCELGRLGFNRESKKGKLQIEYGLLLCNREGCPVAVEVVEDNTADPLTLGSQIKKVRERFGLRRVVIVGDRGMITQARIDQELRGIEGLAWIGALSSSQIAGLLREGVLAPSLFDQKNLAEISSLDFPDERLIACRDLFLAQIAEEAALDGVYVVRTSVDQSAMSASETVELYKDLGAVEQAFRCIKTVDLKVRPIHHRLEGRLRAHVFLCMLAYYLEWHMRKALAPMLFGDETPVEPREDVASPKKPSPGAARKALTKKTLDGAPIHSLQTLLADLSTIVRNSITPNLEGGPAWQQETEPSALQQRAFDLLKNISGS